MPIVHVQMEPRDDESKARIAREIAVAVAEGTNNPVDGVQIVFTDHPSSDWAKGLTYLPRTQRGARANTGMPDFASVHVGEINDIEAYTSLRNEVVNPALAAQPGFVSSLLLRLHDPDGSFLLVNRWLNEEAWRDWGKTDLDRTTTAAQLELLRLWEPRPFDSRANVVHQRFGKKGGDRS